VLKSPAITVATFAFPFEYALSISAMSQQQRAHDSREIARGAERRPLGEIQHVYRIRRERPCADLIKVAMVKVASLLPEDVRMVATVHDELVFDAPIETDEFCRTLVEEKMREAFVEMFGDTVPVEVGAKVCSNWGEKIVGPDLGAWHRAQLSRHGLHCRKRFAKFAAQVSTHFFMLSYDSGRQTPGAASSTAKPSIARLRA
jgi:hypothetical protein